MASIQLRSYQQILGNMISTLLANTDLNDLTPGSVFLTLLEAASASDFKQEGELLQILQIRDVDQAKGVDLENLAAELGVVPSRKGATSAQVQVSLKDNAFTKISSNVFAGTIAPAAGDQILNIIDASAFSASATVYVGRGSTTSEAVAYSSKTNNGTFWTLNLSSPLTKDHFVGEEVVMAQGGDRTISGGTIVQVPSAAGSPAIQFSLNSDATIPDGENLLQGIACTASLPGSQGNVGLNTITQYQALPFSTSAVTNDQIPASGGQDTETDAALRQRIKNWVHDLGRGTETAILAAVVGTSDPVQGNAVVSAFLKEPTETGQLGVLYIDDGTGFEPTFSGIGVESIISSAIGTEQYVQFQNFPMVKSQVASIGTEPYNLNGGERLRFIVDGIAEEQPLPNTQYRTPGVVTAQEVAQTINAVFTTVEARAKNGQLFISPIKDDPDYIEVVKASTGLDANIFLNFPVTKQYTIRLYQNNKLLNKNGSLATIQSFPNSQWPPFSSTETLQLNIDGIDAPVTTFTDALFASFTTSLTVAGATPSDWAILINKLMIGITATAQTDGTFIISSNKGELTTASVTVIGGTLAGRIIDANASATGLASQFTLNRLLGQAKLASPMPEGGSLAAGTVLTEGFVETSAQPIFDLQTTLGTAPKIVMVTNAPGTILPINQTVGNLSYSTSTAGIQRITGTAGQFSSVLPDDWGYFYNLSINGILKVLDVANDGSYVDCFFPDPIAGGPDTPDGLTKQFVFFRTAGQPQEITLPSGVAVAGTVVVSAINSQISGATAVITNNNVIQITTDQIASGGGLFIPLLCGTAGNLGFVAGSYANNDPHLATEMSGDLAGFPSGKLTIQTPDLVAPYDTFVVNGTPFNKPYYNNRPVLDYIGAQSKLIRVPLQIVSTDTLTLREDPPLQIDPLGFDLRATTCLGMEFGQSDNLVVIMDDNPNEKTYDIPLYVDATVAGPSVPSTTQFDAVDSTGALLGSSSRWLGHRFADYRAWFQARTDLPSNVANTQLRITSAQYGPNGKNVRFGVFYPNSANTPSAAAYSVDSINGIVNVNLVLGSLAARTIGLVPNQFVKVSSTGPVGTTYTWTIQMVPPVTLGSVQIGDVVSLNDPNFSAANQVQFAVSTITNLSDSSKTYQFLQEDFTGCTVSGGTSFVLGGTPSQALTIGDKLTITGIQMNATAVGANTVTVPTGGDYVAAGQFSVNNSVYSYTNYNSGTGVFTGVTPNPSGVVLVGQAVLQSVTADTHPVLTVATSTTGTTSSAFYANGSGFNMTLTHAAITASSSPSFTVAPGDKIQVASQLLTVNSVVSPTIWNVDVPFAFTGSFGGVVSRILLQGIKQSAAVSETIFTASSSGVSVLQLDTANTSTILSGVVNNTAGVLNVVQASNSVGSNGSGIMTTSTEDLLANGSFYATLQNGESFVYSGANASPAMTLKVPSDLTLQLGDKIRFVPMTPENIRDHFSRKQISGLSSAATVSLVNGARNVEISSMIPGGTGQVYAVGGKASGNNELALNGPAQEINNSVAVMQLDSSAFDLLNSGHMIRLSQTGRAKKNYVGSAPISSTTAQIQTVNPTTAQLTFGVPLVSTYSYTHTGSVQWLVRQLSRGRLRFEVLSGTAVLPASMQPDDWVFIGNGTSYAGVTPVEFFAAANTGYFQIRETDNSTYFDVDAVGFEQYVTATSAPFVFFTYHSARIGDQIVIGNASPFLTANQGTFTVTAVLDANNIRYLNSNAVNEGPTALGTGGVGSIFLLDQGYSTYRNIKVLAPNPSDPADFTTVAVTPGYNISLLNGAQGAIMTLPNRLAFNNSPVPGIPGYQYWTGLKRTVQRVLDGYEPDPVTYPGVRAAGVAIEAREPQIQLISMSIQVTTNQGTALSAISDTIISSVIGYINSLGLGKNVILSEVVSIVQAISGVQTVVLTNPVLEQKIITVNANAIARTSTSLITLS